MVSFYTRTTGPVLSWIDNTLTRDGEAVAHITREEIDGLIQWAGYVAGVRLSVFGRFFSDEVVRAVELAVLGGGGYRPGVIPPEQPVSLSTLLMPEDDNTPFFIPKWGKAVISIECPNRTQHETN